MPHESVMGFLADFWKGRGLGQLCKYTWARGMGCRIAHSQKRYSREVWMQIPALPLMIGEFLGRQPCSAPLNFDFPHVYRREPALQEMDKRIKFRTGYQEMRAKGRWWLWAAPWVESGPCMWALLTLFCEVLVEWKNEWMNEWTNEPTNNQPTKMASLANSCLFVAGAILRLMLGLTIC